LFFFKGNQEFVLCEIFTMCLAKNIFSWRKIFNALRDGLGLQILFESYAYVYESEKTL